MEASNSLRNQKIKSQFVEMHVQSNVTALVNFVLTRPEYNAPFTWEDVSNMYYYEDWTGVRYSSSQRHEKLEEYRQLLDELEDEVRELPTLQQQDAREVLQDAYNDLTDATRQREEIMEWWIITDWLAEQLDRAKEPVVKDGTNHYWGRKTSGQSIKMDEVIHLICEGLQILEGQANEWK